MYLEPISQRRRVVLLLLVVVVSAAALLSAASVQAAPDDALTCRWVVYPCYPRYPLGWGGGKSCQRHVRVCYYGVSAPRLRWR